MPRLPAGIPGGVEIVVKQETGKPRLHRKAERPEPQIITHKMQTVSHFNECLKTSVSLKVMDDMNRVLRFPGSMVDSASSAPGSR